MKTSNSTKAVDMPKLGSPFIRKMINSVYVVTPEIDPDYQWVFDEPKVKCIEKLDGTNVSVKIKGKQIEEIYNRTNKVGMFSIDDPQHSRINEAVLHSIQKGWLKGFKTGQYFGEVVGDKIQNNPLDLDKLYWMPFEVAEKKLMYASFYQHERTFENWSVWLEKYIFSLMARKYSRDKSKKVKPEGVVFYHPDGKRMAKLRLDMFDWYKGERHRQ